MKLEESIEKLAKEFNQIPFQKLTSYVNGQKMQTWLGKKEDDVMICLLKSKNTAEDYHRQDYFFFNYAYQNSYKALSQKYNNLIDIKENECYFSQPDCGYAINIHNISSDTIIVGVLIKKQVFFKEYLSVIAKDDTLFNFFLIPEKNNFSEEFIKLDFKKDKTVQNLLNLMIMEYADKDNQEILKSYTLSLLLLLAREYRKENPESQRKELIEEIKEYVNTNSDTLSLEELASHFHYHPNYISSFIHKKTGKRFSDLILEKKMRRAKMLLDNTSLSIEDISDLLGYADTSNFYKTFKKYYGLTPRRMEKEKDTRDDPVSSIS